MHSTKTRLLVGLGSIIAIGALLFVFAGGDEGDQADSTASETTTGATATGGGAGGEQPKPEKPPAPEFETIVVAGGEPEGGLQELAYRKGDQVRLEFRSDTADEVHVHGYDLYADLVPGRKAKLEFPAEIDGVFEIELHGTGAQLAQLTVKP